MSETSIVIEKGKCDLPIPTKNGKEFLGWFTGWNDIDIQIDNETIIKKNYSLFAKWDSYDLTYYDGDGSVVDIIKSSPNKHAIEPGILASHAPSSEKPYFAGWDFDFLKKINKDYSIYPLWSENKVTYVQAPVYGAFDDSAYHYLFAYDDNFFNHSATDFDNGLMKYAFGLSLATVSTNDITKYFEDSSFDDIYLPNYYYKETNMSDIAYAFAHKQIDGQDVIAVACRGFSYGKEWASNFNLGNSGDHAGFSYACNLVFNDLLNYVNENQFDLSNAKLFLTGYSRAAAVINLLADCLLANHITNSQKLFAYTFECPKNMLTERAIRYENVFNIINSADLIIDFPPTEYGFSRCGIDVDIYNSRIDQLIYNYDEDMVLPKFVPEVRKYSNEQDLPQYLISVLLTFNSDSNLTISTRENYCNNAEDAISYFLAIVLSLKNSTLNKIAIDASEKGAALFVYMMIQDGLYNYLKPFIDEDGISYEDERLKTSLEVMRLEIYTGALSALIQYPLLLDPFIRLINMHAANINYVLIKNLTGI